jgi:hypothetical protein
VNSTRNLTVLSGLPASGKTTLVRFLGAQPKSVTVPEHCEWSNSRLLIPPQPKTLTEKKNKQLFFFQIDLKRAAWARSQAGAHHIICDSDFFTPLAHNYAERKLFPDLDVYPWLVDLYLEALSHGKLCIADLYIFLDPPSNLRAERRAADVTRKRNDVFFQPDFASSMRDFYHHLMTPTSPWNVVNSVRIENDSDLKTTEATLLATVESGNHTTRMVALDNIKLFLEASTREFQ